MHRFHHRLTLPLILILLILACGALLFGFFNLKQQTTLPSNTNSSALGVELNQNFPYVDLHQLQANGVSFIYLRSMQGCSYFDDSYLSYRAQVWGTKLAFGTIVDYSNQSTAKQHYNYFERKVGRQTGSLPVLIQPVVRSRQPAFLRSMGRFAQLLQAHGKHVLVALTWRDSKYFPIGTQFLSQGPQQPNPLQYVFWCYTTNGRVKNVTGLNRGVTMYAYNGTVAQYRQKYGQLTQ